MKKMFFCSLMLLFAVTINSQTYNSIVLNQNDDTKRMILTNEIDSITYGDLNRQIVWTKDSLYKTDISVLNSTTFEKVELPDVLIKTEGFVEWSEIRIHKDGSLIALKKQGNQDIPSEGCIIMPNENLGVLYSTFKIDKNGVPQYITINDCIITVDDYSNNYIDITVAYNDTIAYSLDSIPYNRNITRAWSENNWQRNLTGILELASGAGDIVGGALLITGSVISEAGSFGGSTPISIPGILAGSATIAGGVSSFSSGWEKLFTSGASQSNIGETIYCQTAGELIANGPQNAYVPEQYFGYLKDPNYSSQLSKIGWINFFVGLTTGIFDNLYGRTVTWEDIRLYYQGKVITGLSKDIATNSATIRGYIAPDITKSLLSGSKIENEYGVVLYSTTDATERHIHKIDNGDGGMIEYCFKNLKPAATYNYRTYFIDKTNGINLLGEIKSFTTLPDDTCHIDFTIEYPKRTDSRSDYVYCGVALHPIIDNSTAKNEFIESYAVLYKDGKEIAVGSPYEYHERFLLYKKFNRDELTIDSQNYRACPKDGKWQVSMIFKKLDENGDTITIKDDIIKDVNLEYNIKPVAQIHYCHISPCDENHEGDDYSIHSCSVETYFYIRGTFWIKHFTPFEPIISNTVYGGVCYIWGDDFSRGASFGITYTNGDIPYSLAMQFIDCNDNVVGSSVPIYTNSYGCVVASHFDISSEILEKYGNVWNF